MSGKRASNAARHGGAPRPLPSWGLLATVAALGIAAIATVILLRPAPSAPGAPVAWTRLGTQDVHSLSFPEGPERLLFGHHGGILRSDDGGRTWSPLALQDDAMSVAASSSDSMIIAGHLVFRRSDDGGRTWSDIRADLPSLDIHAFAQSRSDPDHLWAYLAGGGVYESTDGGERWARVFDGDRVFLTAVEDADGERLLAVDPFAGLTSSADGGRTWTAIGAPPTGPLGALAVTPDGRVVLVGGPDGLHRSDDGGRSWRRVLASRTVLAAAVTDDGNELAAVTQETTLYRSHDGGASWPGP